MLARNAAFSSPLSVLRIAAAIAGFAALTVGSAGCGHGDSAAPTTTPPATIIPKPANAPSTPPPATAPGKPTPGAAGP